LWTERSSIKENSMAITKQHRILIATDGSRPAQAALATVARLLACGRRRLTLPLAAHRVSASARGFREEFRGCCGRGPPRIGAALAGIKGRGHRRAACRRDSRRSGLERALLGSVANGAFNHSPVPVLLVR
jgi:hypothetical protein